MNYTFTGLSYILETLKHQDYYWNIGFFALSIAGFTHLLFIPLFLFLDVPVLALVNILSVAVYFYSIFYLGPNAMKTKNDKIIGWFVYAELIIHGIIATIYLSLESGFQYYIYALAILPFFTIVYSRTIRILRLVGIIGTSILLNIYLNYNPPLVNIDSTYLSIMGIVNLVVFLLIASGLSYFYTLNANTYQKNLLQHSTVDPLTELFNRRYLIEYIERERMHAAHIEQNISLLILDIDFFKKINDAYGHNIGDRVLVSLAKVLKDTLGFNNIISRWGGEEFVILLPNCSRNELEVIATRLLLEIELNTVVDEHTVISITVTIGGTMLLENESFDTFISRADNALYKGKENGRNCYVSA